MYSPQTETAESSTLSMFKWKDSSNGQYWKFNLWEDKDEYKRISVWLDDKKIISLKRVIEIRKNFLLMKNGKITLIEVNGEEKVLINLNGSRITLTKCSARKHPIMNFY